MHVHGAWAQEEILGDLPVRAADGHEPDNLELASGKPAVLELDRSVSAGALIDAFSQDFVSSGGRI
jgi:formate-dependent nitrite reductase cytochrome c552 subunit